MTILEKRTGHNWKGLLRTISDLSLRGRGPKKKNHESPRGRGLGGNPNKNQRALQGPIGGVPLPLRDSSGSWGNLQGATKKLNSTFGCHGVRGRGGERPNILRKIGTQVQKTEFPRWKAGRDALGGGGPQRAFFENYQQGARKVGPIFPHAGGALLSR